MSKRPIDIVVFIHEDLKEINEDQLYADYFDWVADEIARISDRTTDVIFVQPSDAPALCNLDYKTEDLNGLLDSLEDELQQHIRTKDYFSDNRIYVFLLLTRNDINKKTLGVAYNPGNLGIASTTSSPTAAHEIGHMFNAQHEDSDENIDTYFGRAKSIMYASAAKDVAFSFSTKNEENIRRYLDRLK
jgi:hypothetical protein